MYVMVCTCNKYSNYIVLQKNIQTTVPKVCMHNCICFSDIHIDLVYAQCALHIHKCIKLDMLNFNVSKNVSIIFESYTNVPKHLPGSV